MKLYLNLLYCKISAVLCYTIDYSLACELFERVLRERLVHPPSPVFSHLSLPFLSQNWPNGDEVLEDWTQKVAEEHKSHWYCLALFDTVCTCVCTREKKRQRTIQRQGDTLYLPLNVSVLSSRMQTAEAELLYIKEVEKLDGFGQESFPAKVDLSHYRPYKHTPFFLFYTKITL